MGDRRWGFEEAEDWEYGTQAGQTDPAAQPEETLVGQDADHVVQVVVSPDAEVVAVRLSPSWRQVVDPRALHTSVRSAANAATMAALARSVEQVDPTAASASPGASAVDESALTGRDVEGLLDAVDAELRQFTARLSAIVDQPAEVSSSGGHVRGSAQRGQVLALDLDSTWAGRARHTEIETELVEVLRGLHDASTPRELAAGPTGSAISELMELAADPRCLMRRLGHAGRR
ncbi:hypothetical protein LWP59_18380 [Amycolatopsis acidiphila]|uniref:YbaB/EbfC family nucleoid-associated protein n=1 Tax=Amycolatopsis acidiphila TaxID=715473 RepID=A0A557ZTZ1_9PSEU|nr:hypothetical protein [Amycolatopsis acidiphila]TVT15491.1 hypothetical protein FNH06_36110 [Amycolatopsis acidiphila]UIJ63456.1 hypothetical protein LWP59_18380 [Amycolatopsis acidiphila]GHG99139.1 hypothetical protein GCM10017788_79590 [Amycolatopsis acidiphila]